MSVVVGPGQIGQAIARRVGVGKHVVMADRNAANAEEFGNVIARGGSGVVISSPSGHRVPALSVEQNRALATTPTEALLRTRRSSPRCRGPRHRFTE